jgi:hypothetical protein
MEKNIKFVIIGIIILAVVGVLIFVSLNYTGPGGLIGGLSLLWAGFKSKIFGRKTTELKLDQIKEEHQQKRDLWAEEKEAYESKLRALEAQMRYLDYKSALIAKQLGQLDEYEQEKLHEISTTSASDLKDLLNKRNH